MRDNQENKLTMYEAIVKLLEHNESLIATVPAFVGAKDNLITSVNKIKEAARQQKEATAGKRAAKMDAENDLISLMMSVGSALYSYGRKIKDHEMQDIANVRVSKLEDMRDTELVNKAEIIYTKLAANAADLVDYQITAVTVTEFRAKIDNFANALGVRESSAAKSTGATANLQMYFTEADDILNEDMDRMLEMFNQSQPGFYNEYFAARVIKQLGIRHEVEEPVIPTPPTPPTP
jgi:hypothetical protein